MTQPRADTVYEVDPTGCEERLLLGRRLIFADGTRHVTTFGLFGVDFAIIRAANSHASRSKARWFVCRAGVQPHA